MCDRSEVVGPKPAGEQRLLVARIGVEVFDLAPQRIFSGLSDEGTSSCPVAGTPRLRYSPARLRPRDAVQHAMEATKQLRTRKSGNRSYIMRSWFLTGGTLFR